MRTAAGLSVIALGLLAASGRLHAANAPGPLDPRGRAHIAIGLPDALDTLKSFVEAEGPFSPGFATYGVYLWLFDHQAGKLFAPTMPGQRCRHGLRPPGLPIPWTSWEANGIEVRSEVCQVSLLSSQGQLQAVAAGLAVANTTRRRRELSVYAALRPLGPAGGPVRHLSVSPHSDALLVEGHPALLSEARPSAAGVLPTDAIGRLAMAGRMPSRTTAASPEGNCSGALRLQMTLEAGGRRSLGFICPVLAGRRAVAHRWDGKSAWAQLDLAEPNPPEGGIPQPDPGLDFYRSLSVAELFDRASSFWEDFTGAATLAVPDPRWEECFRAICAHIALSMNGGAPDVAVVNYNVFNRDGVYAANILQESGHFALAGKAIAHFISHPFSGRVYPEADNPGQILWAIGQHWLLTGDAAWLRRVFPAVRKLAAMVRYYRTSPSPHWVALDSLAFGEALPASVRKELKPGRCDGHHPEYTEAFDVAGLRAAATLAAARGERELARSWRDLADQLFAAYDEKFGGRLTRGYGSYAVLWPCRLYPPGEGKAAEQFRRIGSQRPGGWRYFPLARAHQSLLAGNRAAGHRTLELHLDHPQMRGWYAFDEGGKSGPGGWRFARTTWNPNVAMPHGWAIAELWLLARDCVLFEDGGRLVLFPGLPPQWFRDPKGVRTKNLPTSFGPCTLAYQVSGTTATLTIGPEVRPPGGFVLRTPPELPLRAEAAGRKLHRAADGNILLPGGTRVARLTFLADQTK